MNRKNYITASEIGEYVYCRRAWWLKNQRLRDETPQMIKGIAHHASMLSRIRWTPRLMIIALLLIGIAIMLVLITIQALTAQ